MELHNLTTNHRSRGYFGVSPWVSRYPRLNTIFERTKEHLVAFIEIAFVSILSRRLARLTTQKISA